MISIFEKPRISILDTKIFDDEGQYLNAYNSVSAERKEKVDFYRFDKDKRLSLAAGLLLEMGLSQFGIKEYSLEYGQYGKPYIREYDWLFFSLSHSGTLAACAFYDKEIGIDIELICDVTEPLIRQVSTDYEYDFLMHLDENQRKEQFFRLWTAKESYMKYLGTGLSLSPQELEICFNKNLTIRHCGTLVPVTFEEYCVDRYKMTVCISKEEM